MGCVRRTRQDELLEHRFETLRCSYRHADVCNSLATLRGAPPPNIEQEDCMPTENSHPLTIRLPQELYDRLKKEADDQERTAAGLVRLLVRRHFEPSEGPDDGIGRP